MSHYIHRQIFKFTNYQIIEMPHCKILSAGIYKGEPCLYLLIDRDNMPLQQYEILMPFTRQLCIVEDSYCFIGSIDIKNITAHIFCRPVSIENKKEIKKRGRPKKYKEIEK